LADLLGNNKRGAARVVLQVVVPGLLLALLTGIFVLNLQVRHDDL
jgi:hypothetical protein